MLTHVAVLIIVCGGCTKRAKVTRHMQRADHYYADGDYDKAEVEYINVMRLDPNSARAIGRIGVMYLEEGRVEHALRPLLRACELDTNNTEFHEKLGLLYLSGGQTKQARDEANFVLDRQPENEEAPLLLADASPTPTEAEAARQRLQRLVVPGARHAAIDVALGNMAFRDHDLKAAAVAYQNARSANPKFGPLHSSLAIYYWFQKDLPHAEEEFRAAVAAAPLRAQARLRYAEFQLRNGQPAAAKAMLEELMQKAPDYLPGNIALAQLAASETNFDGAIVYLNKALARDPEDYEALLLDGQYLMAQGNLPAAVAKYEKLTHDYPKADVPLYNLAMAYKAQKETSKAMASLNQALAVNPRFVEAALELAQMKISAGDYNSAVISLRALLKQRPQFAPAQIMMAEAYQGQGKFDDAAGVYQGLEKAYPTNVQIPLLLGNLFQQENHNGEAREQFSKALSLTPTYLPALEKLVDLDLQEQRYSTALDRVQNYMAKNPKVSEASLLSAKIYLAQGDLKQAASVLDKLIAAQPESIQAYVMLGNAYLEAKDTRRGLEVTHKLLAKYPDQPGGLMLLANFSDEAKDYKTAEQAYEKVIAKNPENGAALNNLAYIYSEHGQVDRGYELARKARELAPRNPKVADTLGWICYKRGDYEQALSLLQEAGTALPGEADIQLHLGMASYMIGDEDHARLSLQFAAQSKEDFPDKELANRSLAILAIDPKSAGFLARNTLEKRIAERPGDIVALSRLAAIYLRENKTDKAISAYETALQHNPKNIRVLVELAQIHSTRVGEQAKALELAKAAYKLAPDDAEVSHVLGRLAYTTGDDKQSYDLLKKAARNRPTDAELQFDLAEAAYSEGRVDEAEEGMRNALQGGAAFSRAIEAKRFLAMAPLEDNSTAAIAASAEVEKALKSDPEYVPALMASGIIKESKNDEEAAKRAYEQVLNRYPDFVRAKRRIAILAAQRPDNDKLAYEYATQAYEVFPNDPELDKALGILVYRQGDYSRSARYLKESASRKAGDAQVLYYLGMAQYKLSDRTNSKKTLLQAIDLKLPDNMAMEAKKVLAQLN